MACNPVYAGFGPFPALVPDEQGVAAAAKAIESVAFFQGYIDNDQAHIFAAEHSKISLTHSPHTLPND